MRERIFPILFSVVAACAPAVSQNPEVGPLGLVAPPPSVKAADVGAHLGELVTLTARTGPGRSERGKLIFPVVGDVKPAVEIVVVPPLLLTDGEKFLQKFSDQDVWVIGRVTDLGGPLQVLTGDPQRLQLAGKPEGDKP